MSQLLYGDRVLLALLATAGEPDLSLEEIRRHSGVQGGRLLASLLRLQEGMLLDSSWDQAGLQRRRQLFRVTESGRTALMFRRTL